MVHVDSKKNTRQPVREPRRQSASQHRRQTAPQAAALPTSLSTVHVWIDGSCNNQCSKVKHPRTGLGFHSPESEYCDLSEQVCCGRPSNWAEALAGLRVLQHVPLSKDLPAHRASKRSSDSVLRLQQYCDHPWRTSTRQKHMTSGLWAMNDITAAYVSPMMVASHSDTINVLFMTRRLRQLCKQQQPTLCRCGRVHCKGQGNPWLP